jgi:hypothetical protein
VSFALDLPNLLYVGDVPVEASYHGSALLYRLLQNYPPEKLRIIESSLIRSLPERRLSRVPYASVDVGYSRLLRTRFARSYSSWLSLLSRRHRRRMAAALGSFRPEAILTLAHGFLWDGAAQFAEEHQLPLHLICHDDWPRFTNVFACLKRHVDRRLGVVYRQATSRLCVSPFMCDAYRERYGASGDVLYPTRAADAPVYSTPPERLLQPTRGLNVAFAGSVNTHGHLMGLRLLAETLATLGGHLLIFGPFTPTNSHCESLNLPNVVCRGLLSSATLMERLREEVDVLFVPMSFAPEDRPNTEISFPSKLTDYTSVGLPLLIYGPDYCSAVQWARQNPCVAELVTQPEFEQLFGAVQRLSRSAETRWQLAQSALTAGEKFFSHHSAMMLFQSALRRK